MIIFYDGSNVCKWKDAPKDRRYIGWGVHCAIGDQLVEQYGAHEFHVNGPLSSWHETIALFEAVKIALAYDARPQDVSFYADDEVAVYGSQQLSGPSFMVGSLDDVLRRAIDAVSRHLYGDRLRTEVLNFVMNSRFVKVRGHKFTVNNLRVDYLAKKAVKVHLGLNATPVLSYEQWLRKGVQFWGKDGPDTYLPPFSHD